MNIWFSTSSPCCWYCLLRWMSQRNPACPRHASRLIATYQSEAGRTEERKTIEEMNRRRGMYRVRPPGGPHTRSLILDRLIHDPPSVNMRVPRRRTCRCDTQTRPSSEHGLPGFFHKIVVGDMDFVAAPSGSRKEDRQGEEGERRAYVRKAFQKTLELCTLGDLAPIAVPLPSKDGGFGLRASGFESPQPPNLPSLPARIHNVQTG